jgi:hypothetical protein
MPLHVGSDCHLAVGANFGRIRHFEIKKKSKKKILK